MTIYYPLLITMLVSLSAYNFRFLILAGAPKLPSAATPLNLKVKGVIRQQIESHRRRDKKGRARSLTNKVQLALVALNVFLLLVGVIVGTEEVGIHWSIICSALVTPICYALMIRSSPASLGHKCVVNSTRNDQVQIEEYCSQLGNVDMTDGLNVILFGGCVDKINDNPRFTSGLHKEEFLLPLFTANQLGYGSYNEKNRHSKAKLAYDPYCDKFRVESGVSMAQDF